MKCPSCGKEIIDGHMYCEDCGAEINLVPEFEAKVEQSIAESIQGILDKVEDEESEASWEKKSEKMGIGYYLSGIFLALLLFFIAAVVTGGVTIWKQSTFFHEVLVEYYLEEGDTTKAITYMEAVVQGYPDKLAPKFELYELYMQNGQKEKALVQYEKILYDMQYPLDVRIAAAEPIINEYIQAGDYAGLSVFLDALPDENMKLAYLEYMTTAVQFNQVEGTYASLITLKLSADGIGSIYYTTDGTTPTKESEKFNHTIFLEAGENVVSAVFINEYGVAGPVVTKTYQIESQQVSIPEVVTYSGTYHEPVRIEIERNIYTSIYYTTDGTAPNRNSTLYLGNLYVPLGKSTFKFVAVDKEGRISEIVTRNFEITLDTEMTTEAATELLVEHFVNQGKLPDGQGHLVYGENTILIYEYLYPFSTGEGQNCYYFAEVLRDVSTMEQHRTGNYFGVNYETGEIYAF